PGSPRLCPGAPDRERATWLRGVPAWRGRPLPLRADTTSTSSKPQRAGIGVRHIATFRVRVLGAFTSGVLSNGASAGPDAVPSERAISRALRISATRGANTGNRARTNLQRTPVCGATSGRLGAGETGGMIIGLSGRNGAGKGEVLAYLQSRSFYAHSLSDVIREELRRQGLSETRERMIETGNATRERRGPGGLATLLAEQILPDRNYVVDSVRHPGEVEVLRGRASRFQLWWVDADEAVRLARMRARGRGGDPQTLEQLRALEGRELGGGDPTAQQLLAVQALADATLRNDGTIAELQAQVQALLERSLFFERPSWDEYFMAIARVVASRSNCVKRKVAAVITRDRRIISKGYNGTPRGTLNCNEGGCPRCNSFAEGGPRLDECLCSHGEENAITQAAYHGVILKGGTIYTTMSPCLMCTKMIINVGLSEVIYNADYPLGQTPLDLLREAGVKVRKLSLANA